MRSLSWKITIAMLATSLIGVALVGFFARNVTAKEFNRLVQGQNEDTFIAQVMGYYEEFGTWQGLEGSIPRRRRGPINQLPTQEFVLVDQNGKLILGGGRFERGTQIPEKELERGTPIYYNGEFIGTVLAPNASPELDTRQQEYLASIDQALGMGIVGVSIVALVVSIILAQTFMRPLRALTEAISKMRQGQLKQQVKVASRDEIGELARTFNEMSEELARSNQLRQQMTADIAHDLRTPLTVIAGYLEGLRDGVLKPSDERFDAMYSETMLLQHLIEDLRTLSLADAGELKLNRTPVRPDSLLVETARSFEPLAHQKNIQIEVDSDPNLQNLRVDAARMMQVFGNLVSNALRYTPDGGKIRLSAQQQFAGICFAVTDTGAGIAPEKLPYVFERFYRADSARYQEGGESGLGLAIARSIVEAHQGKITAESVQGQGTSFIITLPADTAA